MMIAILSTTMTGTLLQAAPSGGGAGGYTQLIMFAAIFLVFYLFMIRPQQKRAKDQRQFIQSVKKGDMIVTISGLHGRIVELDDLTVTLEVDRGVRLRHDRSSISMEATRRINQNATPTADSSTSAS